jgi:DNA-binding transcriptional MerR regulator
MVPMTASESRRSQSAKSASAFRTISEVSDDLDVPQHVLRFWETKFSHIKPMKRGGGRRYYRPEDVALLRRIRELLYTEGYTIKGVQRLLRQSGVKAVLAGREEDDIVVAAPVAVAPAAPAPTAEAAPMRAGLDPETRSALQAVLAELTALREMLPRGNG